MKFRCVVLLVLCSIIEMSYGIVQSNSDPSKKSKIPPAGNEGSSVEDNGEKFCAATAEYFPVCGTDNLTYGNPSVLKCAQKSGKKIEIKHYGECEHEGVSDEDFEKCIYGCPAPATFIYVCGTDGVTYGSLSLLNCSRNCGKNVELKHYGKCESDDQPRAIVVE